MHAVPRRCLRHLCLAALAAALSNGPALAAEEPPTPAWSAERLAPLEAGMVRVDMDLRYDRGEAPYGVVDQDPGSRQDPIHSLADVVQEERPLETTGFLIGPDTVVAMDPTLHPRFVQAIRVRHGAEERTARITGYGRNHWVIWLQLDRPFEHARPLRFASGKPSHVVTSYRLEGGMITDVLPFPSRLQRMETGPVYRVAENQGVATDLKGTPLGLVLARHLPAGDDWQGDPGTWPRLTDGDHQSALTALRERVRGAMPRVRLSFRSPKASGPGRERFRPNDDDEEDLSATEVDHIGILVPGGRVVIPVRLRPKTTARLERILVHLDGTDPVPARFEASLRDLGALVAVLEQDPGRALALDTSGLQGRVEHYLLRADVAAQGENRTEFYQHTRIGSLRVGRRLEPYPELADPTATERAHLFAEDGTLLALPMKARSRFLPESQGYRPDEPVLTPARLVAAALGDLAAASDPANIPLSEADENRVAWLGTELQGLTRDLARANKVSPLTRDGETGALVTYVHPGSPAAEAGIQPGTILLRIITERAPAPLEVVVGEDSMRGQAFPWDRLDEIPDQYFDRLPTPWSPVENRFVRLLTDLGTGTRYRLEYLSGGVVTEREFTVEPGPVHYEAAPRYESPGLGLTVRDLTYEVRRYTQRRADDPGVIVSSVDPGSRASVAGIKPYEVITHVGDQPVRTVADFESLVNRGQDLQLTVKRMSKGRIVSLRPGN